MDVVRFKGVEPALYQVIGPLVMDRKVIKQNLNFPFYTNQNFVWYVAMMDSKVIGFVPVERKPKKLVINNYYIENKDPDTLTQLLTVILLDYIGYIPSSQEYVTNEQVAQLDVSVRPDGDSENKHPKELHAISFLDDVDTFRKLGFVTDKNWVRYTRMVIRWRN